jgi:hypothetical protein
MTIVRSLLRSSLFAWLLFGVSCESTQDANFNQGYGLRDAAVLIVPFAEPRNHRFYGESRKGVYLADSIKAWAARNWSAHFPGGEAIDKVLERIRDWPKQRIEDEDWLKLVRGLDDIQYLVHGQILETVLSNPNQIAIVSASIRASYSVVDLERQKVIYQLKNKRVSFGDYGDLGSRETPHIDLGPMEGRGKKIEVLLVQKLAEKIGKDFYGYVRD